MKDVYTIIQVPIQGKQQDIRVPGGTTILSATRDYDSGDIVLFTRARTNQRTTFVVRVFVVGTGDECPGDIGPDSALFLCTVGPLLMHPEAHVFFKHVYSEKEEV